MQVLRTIGFSTVALMAAVAPFSIATPAQADEIFICDDQSMILVTSKNRAAMAEHPCVKAWFDRNREAPVRRAAAVAASTGDVAQAPAAVATETATETAAKPEAGDEPAEENAGTAKAAEDEKKPNTVKFGRSKRSF